MDDIDEDFLFCHRCGYGYECGICGDYFKPTVHETIDGVIFEGQTDYCLPCYARECVSIEEEMELNGASENRIR